MAVVHVDGVQGSGKSYLISKIKHILCVDTDDIMDEAIATIEASQKTKDKMPRTYAQKKLVEKAIISKYVRENDRIVFVGMTATIPRPTHKFFIKITDPSAVYRRLQLRELEKIVENYEKIKRHIAKEADPREIDVQQVARMSLPFPVSYDEFLEDYTARLQKAKAKKYLPKTQAQIIEILRGL